jgi:ribosomal-protein-alanine N-acetyltransferase
VTLEVREHNLPARKTYEHLGFFSCGKRPHYYADSGEDAVLMRLLLTDM